jgi:hypothetical protein
LCLALTFQILFFYLSVCYVLITVCLSIHFLLFLSNYRCSFLLLLNSFQLSMTVFHFSVHKLAEVIYLLFVVLSFCRFVFSSFCRVPNCHILMAWGEHFCWRLLKQDVWLGKVNNVTFITSRRWKRIIFQNHLFQSFQGQIVNEPKSHHHKLLFWYGLKIFEFNDFILFFLTNEKTCTHDVFFKIMLFHALFLSLFKRSKFIDQKNVSLTSRGNVCPLS